MTRDGLVERDAVTGEETSISGRDAEFDLRGKPPASPSAQKKRRKQQTPADADAHEAALAPDLEMDPEDAGKLRFSRKNRDTGEEKGKKPRQRRRAPDDEPLEQDAPPPEPDADEPTRPPVEDTPPPNKKRRPRQSAQEEKKRAPEGDATGPQAEGPRDPGKSKLHLSEEERAGRKISKLEKQSAKVDAKLDEAREKIPKKRKRRVVRTYAEAKGKASHKLVMEEQPLAPGEKKAKMPVRAGKAAGGAAVRGVSGQAHRKIHEVEGENVAVEATHKGELAAERGARNVTRSALRYYRNRPWRRVDKLEKQSAKVSGKLSYHRTMAENPQLKGNPVTRIIQKQRLKRQYAKAAREAQQAAQKTASVSARIARALGSIFRRHPALASAILLVAMILFLFLALFSSCSNLAMGTIGGVFFSSYVAEETAIDQAELYYTELETDLQLYIASLEADNPGYDVYQFSVMDISHNPYELLSFLTAVYGEFTFEEVKPALDALFAAQYSLTSDTYTETRTETRTIEVGGSIGQVRTSAYCPCTICCGPYADGITASGTMATAGRTIAVDAYNPILPMGTKVVIGGVQYTVEDTGNLNANNVDFDIFFATHQEALNWGKQTQTAYLAEGNENVVEVTVTETVKVLEVNLTSTSFTDLITQLMDEEQREHYNVLMEFKGNRQIVSAPFDFNWLPYITSQYGWRIHPTSGAKSYHKGVDIGVSQGTPILATHGGTVTFAGVNGDYGNVVILDNGKGVVTKYAHCATMLVSAGQVVETGDQIATVGSTGNSTGPHLHFEILLDGEYLNPLFFVETNDDGNSPRYGNGGSALGDDAYAALIAEAEKHLGKPYYMGANGPNSFDCSSFVCWVYRESGVWNISRTTAQGIYNQCTPIQASEAKPGDIIFFQGTYSTTDTVTHVGIYVGDGMMIHAGSPIQYTSINSSYWQSHFYSYGRIPN